MAADVGQASACAGLQSRWRDSYERCGRRAKAPPQAEACPTWTGGPTLARKCEVIPAPALRGHLYLTLLMKRQVRQMRRADGAGPHFNRRVRLLPRSHTVQEILHM